MKISFALVIFSMLPSAGPVAAAPPVIGTVISAGSFRLNGDTVVVNGTLFDGALLETSGASSLVRLAGGARFTLAPGSRGRLYSDHLALEKGETRLENSSGIRVEVLGLAIRPDRAASRGRIGLLGEKRIRVEAIRGEFRISNSRGVLVANVAAGSALAFEPQENPNVSTRLTGVLVRQDGHFVLTDDVTHVTVELSGPGLEAYVGLRIEVAGFLDAAATPVTGASQVIRVAQVRTLGGGGAKGGGTAGSRGGRVSGTTIAVISGVTVAVTLGGLAANDLLPGQGGGVSR